MTTDAEGGEPLGEHRGTRDRRARQCTEAVAAAIHEDAQRVKQRELEEALGKLQAGGELDERRRDAVETMADAIVDALVGEPTARLRDAAGWTVTNSALRLFDSAFGSGSTRRPSTAGTDATEGDDAD